MPLADDAQAATGPAGRADVLLPSTPLLALRHERLAAADFGYPFAMLPARAFAILIGVILLAIVATTLITGDPLFLIPGLVLLALICGYAVTEKALKMRLEARHDGDLSAAMADSEDPIPSTHLIADDETPLGATSEAHDDISPHDLPKGHPSRAAIADAVGEDGTLRGTSDDGSPASTK